MNATDAGGMLVLGLLGSTHCMGMCSGFVLCLQTRTGRRAWRASAAWHFGRLATYCLLGALLGGIGMAVRMQWDQAGGRVALIVAGSFMALAGLALLGIGPRPLESLAPGGFVVKPLAALLRRTSTASALALGAFTGFLPCGLLYAALARAAASASPWQGAALMAAFCLGTAPALLGVSLLAPLLRGRMPALWPRLAGLATLIFGIATLWSALATAPCPHCHP